MKSVVNNIIGGKGVLQSMGNALNSLSFIPKRLVSHRSKTESTIQLSPMLCPLTGALSRIGLRKYVDQIAPSDLSKMSLVFIKLDYSNEKSRQLSKKNSDILLKKFVNDTILLCTERDLISRWELKEFILVVPDMQLEQAKKFANKICTSMNNKTWIKDTDIRCKANASQASGEDLHYQVTNMKNNLDKSQ